MPSHAEFPLVFQRLRAILKPYEPRLVVTADEPEGYSLNTPFSARYKKELFFGAVQINKNYVSFHLMPVYMYPALLDDISPVLRKRMQGKSCFNFTTVDEGLFAELAQLAEAGVARVKAEDLS